MKKSTKITIIAMSLVIALLIAAVGVLWYSLNTAETFANRSRTDIALGKYEILRDRSASPEKFLEACLPALRAYVTGEGIKQRINKLSKEEKKAKEQELPVTEKPSKNNKTTK